MFETTHVVITSELSRANAADTAAMNADGLGTPHWPWIQAAIFGGRFKPYAFGRLNNQFVGVPANFNTGAMGQGTVPTVHNLQATLMEANGIDPSGWTSAPPIRAVLR